MTVKTARRTAAKCFEGTPGPLLKQVAAASNLQAAWERVRMTAGAETPGVDGCRASSLAGRERAVLETIGRRLLEESYRFAPPRRIEIPKSTTGRNRILGIPTIADRIVYVAVKEVLEPIFEPRFHPLSFGFRPGRSVPLALEYALRLLQKTRGRRPCFPFAVHLDIADCFDTIDHAGLFAAVRQRVQDEAILRLISSSLNAAEPFRRPGGLRTGCPGRGVLQGSPLSPLLCNIYLDSLDQALAGGDVESRDRFRVLRYADDLLVIAASQRGAQSAITKIRRWLTHHDQDVREPIADVGRAKDGFEWLGLRVQSDAKNRFLCLVPNEKGPRMVQRIHEILDTVDGEKPALAAVRDCIDSLNRQIQGWRTAYRIATNKDAVLEAPLRTAFAGVESQLVQATGQSRAALAKRFLKRHPDGRLTWSVGGVELACPALGTRSCSITPPPRTRVIPAVFRFLGKWLWRSCKLALRLLFAWFFGALDGPPACDC